MQTPTVPPPTNSPTDVVVSLTKEECKFIAERVTTAARVALLNMGDRGLPEHDRAYYKGLHQFAVQLLTKLGV